MSTGAKSDLNQTYFQAIVPGTSWKQDFTAAAVAIGPFGANTSLISLFPTQDCWVRVGGSGVVAVPIASGGSGPSLFVPGGIQNFIGISPGQYLSIVQDTNSGSIHVCEAQ